nr:tyrosine-type recombinase/integrase [Ramlibacter albus]
MQVRPPVSASWVFRYSIPGGKAGKATKNSMGLGPFPGISLKEAKQTAEQLRGLLARGIDPVQYKRAGHEAAHAERARQAHTVGAAVEAWLVQDTRKLTSPKYAAQKGRRLDDALDHSAGRAALRGMPVAAVETADIAAALEVFTARKAPAIETARRVLQDLTKAFDWARGKGWRKGENPCTGVVRTLEKPQRVGHRAPHVSELGGIVRAIRGGAKQEVGVLDYSARLAELLLLTAARTKEIRLAKWGDVKQLDDDDAARIEVPAERMKKRKPWIVPLSRQASAILRELRAHAEEYVNPNELVFFRYAGAGAGAVCSENAVNDFLDRIGLHGQLTGHGFRKLFSTAAHSMWPYAGVNRAKAIEHALAHVNSQTVEETYNKSDYMDERRKLAQWWADHLDTVAAADGAAVVEFKRPKKAA